MEVINGIQGIRDLRNYSAAKDIMAEHPDYMTNPDVIAEVGKVNPQMGMALVDHAQAARQMWQQQAAQRLMAQTQAWDSAMGDYVKENNRTGGTPASAEKAGNDKLQAYYNLIEQQYGPGFANSLRKQMPTFTLQQYGTTRPLLDQAAEGMREPLQAVSTDPATGKKTVTTVRLLPFEQKDYLKQNPGTVLLKQGEAVPETTSYGGALEAGTTSRGEMKENPLAQAAITLGDKLSATPQAQVFNQRRLDRADVVKALQEGNRIGDLTAMIKFMHMHNPQVGVTEGSVITAQQAANWGLPQQLVNMWNGLQGNKGTLTTDARHWVDETTRGMYVTAAEQVADRRKEYGDLAEAFGQTAEQKKALRDAVLKRVPQGDDVLGQPIKNLPAGENAPAVAPPPEKQAAAKQQYDQVLSIAQNPKAAPAQQAAAMQQLRDDDLRAMAADTAKLAPDQITRLWAEYKRRGWL